MTQQEYIENYVKPYLVQNDFELYSKIHNNEDELLKYGQNNSNLNKLDVEGVNEYYNPQLGEAYKRYRSDDSYNVNWNALNEVVQNRSEIAKREADMWKPDSEDSVNPIAWLWSYGVDKDSWKWRKSSYLNSMSYEIERALSDKAEDRLDFRPETYHPNLGEEVLTSVMSLFYPADFIAMRAGGQLGGSLAGNKFIKKGLANKIVKGNRFNKVFPNAGASNIENSVMGGSAGAGSFATYESGKAVLKGYNDGLSTGEIFSKGLEGFAHGLVLGGLSGATGGYLRGKNIQAVAEKEAANIITKNMRIKQWLTGEGGQIGAETGIFTVDHLRQVANEKGGWEKLEANDIFHSLATSFGTILGAKGIHKTIEKLPEAYKKAIEENSEKQWKERNNKTEESIKNVEDSLNNDSALKGNNAYDTINNAIQKGKKGLNDFLIKEGIDLNKLSINAKQLISLGVDGLKNASGLRDTINQINGALGVIPGLVKSYKEKLNLTGSQKGQVTIEGKKKVQELKDSIKKLELLEKELNDISKTMDDTIINNLNTSWSRKDILNKAKEVGLVDTFKQRVKELKNEGMNDKQIDLLLTESIKREIKNKEQGPSKSKLGTEEGLGSDIIITHKNTRKTDAGKKKSFFESLENIINSKLSDPAKNLLSYIADSLSGSYDKSGINKRMKEMTGFFEFLEKRGKNFADMNPANIKQEVKLYVKQFLKTGKNRKEIQSSRDKTDQRTWDRILGNLSTSFSILGTKYDILKTKEFKRFNPKGKDVEIYITGPKGKASQDIQKDIKRILKSKLNKVKDIVLKGSTYSKNLIKSVWRIAHATGGRPEEFLKIQLKHIDIQRKRVSLFEFKGGKEYVINLDSTLISLIKSLTKGKNPDDYVFLSEKINNRIKTINSDKNLTPMEKIKQINGIIARNITDWGKVMQQSAKDMGEKFFASSQKEGRLLTSKDPQPLGGHSPFKIFRMVTAGKTERLSPYRGTEIAGKRYEQTAPTKYKTGKGKTPPLSKSQESKVNLWLKKVASHLKFKLVDKVTGDKTGDKIGRILGHEVEILKGKVEGDVKPHEVTHNYIDVLSVIGGPRAKKLLKRGIDLFTQEVVKKGGLEGKNLSKKIRENLKEKGEERFTDVVGRKVLNIVLSKPSGKVKAWLKQVYGRVKNSLGIASKKDIANIVGWEVFTGRKMKSAISEFGITAVKKIAMGEGVKFKQSLEAAQSKASLRRTVRNMLTELNIPEKSRLLKDIAREIGIEDIQGQFSLGKIKNQVSLEHIRNEIENIYNVWQESGGRTGANSLKLYKKISKIQRLELDRNITEKESSLTLQNAYGKKNLYDLTLSEANNYMQMLKEYGAIIKNKQISIQEQFKQMNMVNMSAAKETFMTSMGYFAPVHFILNKFGGNAGKDIANRLIDHTYRESVMFGIADVAIPRVVSKLKDAGVGKTTATVLNALWTMDKGRVKSYLDKKYGKKLDSKEQMIYDALYTKDGKPRKTFTKKQKLIKEAINEFKNMTDAYWKHIESTARKNMTDAEFQHFKAEYNKKYVNTYFTRRLTKNGLRWLKSQDGLNAVQKLALSNIDKIALRIANKESQTLNQKDKKFVKVLKEIKSVRFNEKSNKLEAPGLSPAREKVAVGRFQEALSEIHQAMLYKPSHVSMKNLIERTGLLPEIAMINGKEIRVYEHKFSNSIAEYIKGMSKFIATGQTFSELTIMHGSKSPYSKISTDLISLGEGKVTSVVIEALNQQVGMKSDAPAFYSSKTAGQLARFVSQQGLMSPMSGVKNLVLGTIQNTTAFGLRNTMIGYKDAILSEQVFLDALPKAITSKPAKSRKIADERGITEFGYRAYEVESNFMASAFKINLMHKTEQWNRVSAMVAGELAFHDRAMVLQGKHGMPLFNTKRYKNMVKEELAKKWFFSEKDINFMQNYNSNTATKFEQRVYQGLLNRVRHHSHTTTQGATNPVYLPLWMSKGFAKPLTVFQRIATSVTYGIYNSAVMPLKYGNPAPLMRHALGGYLGGELLYYLNSLMYGYDYHNASEEDMLSWKRIITNLYKAEFLGILTDFPGTMIAKRMGAPLPNIPSKSETFSTGPLNSVTLRHVNTIVREVQEMGKRREVNKNIGNITFDIAESMNPLISQINKVYKFNKSPLTRDRMEMLNLINQYRKSDPTNKMEEIWSMQSHKNSIMYTNLKDAFLGNGVNSKEFKEQFDLSYMQLYTYYNNPKFSGGEGYDPRKSKDKAIDTIKQVLESTNPIGRFSTEDDGKYKSRLAYLEKFITDKDPKNWSKLFNLNKKIKDMVEEVVPYDWKMKVARGQDVGKFINSDYVNSITNDFKGVKGLKDADRKLMELTYPSKGKKYTNPVLQPAEVREEWLKLFYDLSSPSKSIY